MTKLSDETRAAILRDLQENEFRAGEFRRHLAAKHGVSETTVTRIAAEARGKGRRRW